MSTSEDQNQSTKPEYTLTADEAASIAATVAYFQEQTNTEVGALIRSIIRHRKLPNANWSLGDDNRLVAQ